MTIRKRHLAQKFVDDQGVIELVLDRQRALELIALISTQCVGCNPAEEVVVIHFLLSKLQHESALVKNVYMPRCSTMSHIDTVKANEKTRIISDEQEVERLAEWLNFLDN